MTISSETTGAQMEIVVPEKLAHDVSELVQRASEITIASDQDYAAAAAFLNELGRGITQIEDFFKPHKQKARATWQGLVDDEKDRLAPLEAARTIVRDKKMKPYYLEQERLRAAEKKRLEEVALKQAEERKQAEIAQAKKEAEEKARIEIEAANQKAQQEKEASERQAKAIEADALKRADELLASGKADEAQRVLDDAAQRQQNLRDDAEETAERIQREAADEAERVTAEGEIIAQDIASTAVHVPIVSMAAAPKARGTSAAKKFKADRETYDKRKAVAFIAAEVARGNVALLSWFDLNFAKIDQSAGQMQELFPSFETCGIKVGEDTTIRGSRK